MTDDLMQIANNIVEGSGGRIRLAFAEEDEERSICVQAAHFLKLDGKRIGRDIELYGFMSRIQGEQATLADFLAEVVLRLKSVPESYAVGIEAMRTFGKRIYPPELFSEWEEVLNS